MRGDQLEDAHPKSAGSASLVGEGLKIGAACEATSSQNAEPAKRGLQLVDNRKPGPVAGVFAGAAIGRTEPRHQTKRQQEEHPREVTGGKVAQLVADHEIELPRIGTVVRKLRVDDHEAAGQQLGRERVEDSA